MLALLRVAITSCCRVSEDCFLRDFTSKLYDIFHFEMVTCHLWENTVRLLVLKTMQQGCLRIYDSWNYYKLRTYYYWRVVIDMLSQHATSFIKISKKSITTRDVLLIKTYFLISCYFGVSVLLKPLVYLSSVSVEWNSLNIYKLLLLPSVRESLIFALH